MKTFGSNQLVTSLEYIQQRYKGGFKKFILCSGYGYNPYGYPYGSALGYPYGYGNCWRGLIFYSCGRR
jgi:hypothetical protein